MYHSGPVIREKDKDTEFTDCTYLLDLACRFHSPQVGDSRKPHRNKC